MSPDQLRDTVREAAGPNVFDDDSLEELNNPTQLLQYCCPTCHTACPAFPGGPPLGQPLKTTPAVDTATAAASVAKPGQNVLSPSALEAPSMLLQAQAGNDGDTMVKLSVFDDASQCGALATTPDAVFEIPSSSRCRSMPAQGFLPLPSVQSYRLSCTAGGLAQGTAYSQPCSNNSPRSSLATFAVPSTESSASCVMIDGKAVMVECPRPEESVATGKPVAVAMGAALLSAYLAH